jgi:hypothetical protein
MKRTLSFLLAIFLLLSGYFSVYAVSGDWYAAAPDSQRDYNKSFNDVTETDWFYESVMYCSAGYITGYEGLKQGYFGPADSLQRQDFAVIMLRFGSVCVPYDTDDPNSFDNDYYESYNELLPEPVKPKVGLWNKTPRWNMDELIENMLAEKGQLKDIPSDSYYTLAVNSLRALGIISGYENGYFGVGDNVTREQVVTILYRYENKPEITDEMYEALDAYNDSNKISSWARDAFAWAVSTGVIKGKNSNTLAPTNNITRAEVAAIIQRLDHIHHIMFYHSDYREDYVFDTEVDENGNYISFFDVLNG